MSIAMSVAEADPAPPRPPRPDGKIARRRGFGRWAAVTVMAASVLLVTLVAALSWSLPLGKALAPMASPTLVLVTTDGKPFARRGSYKDAPVDAAKLPRHVTMAFVAIEDRRFYRHGGVDPRGISRAFVSNLKRGGISQGGSTITQQLAKNAFTDGKRTYWRKAREAVIAVYLEGRLSKDEILSRYLSSVYFGDGVFGLRGAARHYFDKAPEELSVGEAAMLAGVVRSPTKLAPTEHLEAAKARMKTVLAAMVDAKVITEAQASAAAKSVKLRDGRPDLPIGSYFADWISPQTKGAFDRAYGEVTVQTTLDSGLQAQAEKALKQVLAASGGRLHASQGAVVAMRTDGSILALVGGRDYGQSQFNRATQAQRQPGSSFKPFVYLAAFRAGATPDTLVLDAPVKIGGWSPENHESHYANAPITLRDAFAKSSNVAAVRLEQQVGIGAVQKAARDLGVTAPLPNDMTLALGSANLTLLQLTSAYAGIAAGAAPVTPRGLAKQPPAATHPVLRPSDQQAMLQLMSAVMTSGTGSAANPGVPAFGKTGTSQDYRDAYFVGFVGDLVIGVWVGNDDNTPMNRVVGGMLPAQIWRQVMTYALAHGQAKAAQAQMQAVEVAPPTVDAEPPEANVESAAPLTTDDERSTGFYRNPRPRERAEPPPAAPPPSDEDRGAGGQAGDDR